MNDQPTEVRQGEQLDITKLSPWLLENTALQAPFEIQQFPAGHSNLTYLIRDSAGEDVVLRRPPRGAKIKSGHDMGREYRVLSALQGFDASPSPLALCEDLAVIGAPFYLMERINGVILRGPKDPAVAGKPEQMAQVCSAFVDTFVEIHGLNITSPPLADLGRPLGYVQRQVSGWTGRYQKSKTDDIPHMDSVATWLAHNMPTQSEATLIHNDFKYDNLVLDPNDLGQVMAVLDWEMATLGDPLMDLGSTLGYWVQSDDPEFLQVIGGPTALQGNLTRRQLVDTYARRSQRNVDNIVFYYAYGLFKLGVIAQQIYHRFKNGLTNDPRFGGLIFVVQAVSEQAAHAIEKDEI